MGKQQIHTRIEDKLQPFHYSRMSIHTTVPPAIDPPLILRRTDEVHTILRIFSEPTTGVVVLTGDAGAGKSMLAALVYRSLEAAAVDRVPLCG